MSKKFTENILIANFTKESVAYQAFSELKQAIADEKYFISQAAIVKRENGELVVKDEFETGVRAMDDTLKGSLIGGLVGMLGGPLGVLLGGSVGALIGEVKDTGDVMKDLTLLDTVSECIVEGETALLILADEKGDAALSEKLSAFDAAVTRLSAAEVEKEIECAAKAEEKREEQARKKYDKIKVSENLLFVNYKEESEAYQAFSDLKQAANDYYYISQAAIVKKENGEYIVKDEFDNAIAVDDTLKGGLIGGLIGLLGGPLGVLYGGTVGAAIGEVKDTGDILSQFGLIEYVYEHIAEGETVLVILADEKGDAALTEKLNAFDVTIERLSAAKVAKEMERAAELEFKREQKELEQHYTEQAEDTDRELSDWYNRSGEGLKL